MRIAYVIQDEQLQELLKSGKNLDRAVVAGVRAIVLGMVRYTIKTKFANQGPRYLNRKTGTAIRSITASPAIETSAEVVRGTWGSNLGYVRKHEEGGTFRERVRSYSRRVRSRDVRRTVQVGDKQSRRIVAHGIAFVREHDRTRVYQGRHMFKDALDEKKQSMVDVMRKSVAILIEEKRIANQGDLSGWEK